MELTPERMQAEERHAALMAVAHSLTAFEQVKFRGKAVRRWPRFEGALVADVLDVTADHDMFLAETEAFFTKFGDQLPEAGHAAVFAMHAILILGLELSPARVAYFMQRAGVTEAPRYPDVEVGLLLEGSYRDEADPARGANHLLLMARAEQGLRARGVTEYEITQFRESVRQTGLPGYSRNVADIAAWVTLTDRYTSLPRKVYDPIDDLAVVVMFAGLNEPDGGEVAAALANLRSHLDLRQVETIKSGLAAFFGKEMP